MSGANGRAGKLSVLVLGGGPDAEREVSLKSSATVAQALQDHGCVVHREIIQKPSATELAALPGDVVFPVLHGGWGEGGPLQDLLELGDRPYVGCRPGAARMAMDKLATKLAAARCGVLTADAAVINPRDEGCPIAYPVVIKPVHEGSSVGVHFCKNAADWASARAKVLADMAAHPGRLYMIERAVLNARELTVGVLDGEALPIIEITAAVAFYDYEAKYNRNDTNYKVNPALPAGLEMSIQDRAVRLAREIGVRHLCRVDFLLDSQGAAWLLELNTLPGFTDHSLFPMAARATGLETPALCGRLVDLAVRDGVPRREPTLVGQQ